MNDINQSSIKKIKVSANVGLIGSLVIIVAAILFKYISKQAFYQSEQVFRTLTIIGLIFSVGGMAIILLGLRRNTAKLRQIDDLTQKLKGYASFITTISYSLLIMTLLLCAIIVLTGNYNLLMIAMLMVIILFFCYPNMYKIKVDLGLNDPEMIQLFGNKYVTGEDDNDNTPIQDPLEIESKKDKKDSDTQHPTEK